VPDILTPDLCVIGAGSGGLSVAAAAAMMGVPVVLVERHRMGGDCLNVGCVPSKALIAAGHHAEAARRAKQFGIGLGEPRIDFEKVHAHVHGVIASIAPNDSVERFTALGVKVMLTEGHFIDRRTLKVGETLIRARRFVIATGSTPVRPEIPGVVTADLHTNETIFDLKERPKHLLVMGGGPIGAELAQAFRRLGTQVTLVTSNRLMPREDEEAARIVAERFRQEGITLHENAKVLRAEPVAQGYKLTIAGPSGETTITADKILAATGRTVRTETLGLEAADVKRNERGIIVDKSLRTSNSRIYAIGDCAGGPQFTHAAGYHAGLVIRNALFRQPVKVDYSTLPRVTYTDPEIAAVGLSEDEAFKADPKTTVLRWPFAENDRAQAERETHGFVKILMSSKGKALGVTIVGVRAGELLTPWILAMKNNLPVSAMTDLVIPYPTFSEASRRAAVTALAPKLRSPWLPRILRLMRSFG
jgi:pyruvate/2-oxoglutarate dehydrogenase complex dihydrolipoamide dehydrogenase (E3) component